MFIKKKQINMLAICGVIFVINDCINYFTNYFLYFYIDHGVMILACFLLEIIILTFYKNKKIKKILYYLITIAIVIAFLSATIDLITHIYKFVK